MEVSEKDYWIRRKYWGPLGLCALIMIVILFTTVLPRHELKKNHLFTSGFVVDIKRLVKGGFLFTYIYSVDGISYKNTIVVGRFKGNSLYFLNERFPVIYSNKDPQKSEILVDPTDYGFFDIPIPDSIKIYSSRFY